MKNEHLLKWMPFPVLLVAFSIPVYLLLDFFQDYIPAKAVYHRFWIIQLLMLLVSWIIHRGLANAAKKSGPAFIRFFMMSSGLKLFVFMIIMIVYGIADAENAFGFIFHFLLLYLLYTTAEVWVSFKSFGPQSKP